MIGAYSKAKMKWPGWRRTLPGGPANGIQQHGYLAATVDPRGWDPTVPNTQGHGSQAPWDTTWGGTVLDEGQTVSDYVYRSPSEMRPRANANGGANVVFTMQTKRSPGYAVAPGGYAGLGLLEACPEIACDNQIGQGPAPCFTPICGPVTARTIPPAPGSGGSGATATITQPAPVNPSPINVVGWTTPPTSPTPSPTVAATPTPVDTSDWFAQQTIFPGVDNWLVLGGAAIAGYFLLRGHL
jgi:hypothetical protein